ncbi:putative HlyIII domain protein [Rhizoctonia solani 123E]|uniref:Putative HlyIII domain protein n=1 Tax=Rhizoctonia solani 123E TaxID=1423351 RepID=A0A074SC53_9AGAM|nr:putative HlyIII domain protein [Rhizoctonia solani 123E]
MIIRYFGSTFWLLLAHLISTCSAFSFVFSSQPSQCQSLTIQWTGGTGPYRLFLVPVGHVTPEIRSIVSMEIPAGQSSTNLTLRFPENSHFVAIMSDSTGFGTGGTSSIYTVGSGASSCLPTTTPQADFYMYTDSDTPSQCGSYRISWDAGVASPVHIYGIIPGGQSFQVNTPSSDTSYGWTTNVRAGTQMLFLAVGGNNENGGSTDITTIAGGSSGCINSQSPSSTASPAVGGISTIAQSAPATMTVASPTAPATVTIVDPTAPTMATTPNPTAGETGTAGGSASAPATNTNTAEGTGGGSANPTATATGGNGSPPSPTNSNNPPLSTTRGSGGGTVTGEPHLPAATGGLHNSNRRVNLGAIIGGTLGGIALLLFLLFMWLMCHKRAKRTPDDSERLITERRTDLLDDSFPVMTQNQDLEHDWFRAEPFVPPMSADEFAQRTGGSIAGREDQGDDYNYDQSRSSMDHIVTSAGVYGVIGHSISHSNSGYGHRSSYSQNISHSPAHSTSRHASSHGHSRSFSNPYSFTFTPNSGTGRRDTTPLTPPTPMSIVDPNASPTRPPPSSWHNQASTSANVVPRSRRSGSIHEQYPPGKSGIEDEGEVHDAPDMAGDIVDIPPSYASLRRPRVTNPDATD